MTIPRVRFASGPLLVAALLLALVAAAGFKIMSNRPLVHAIAVIDVTGSMNVRDVESPLGPVSRLKGARDRLKMLTAALPCGSKLGLGIFTERRAFLLYEPIEVCGNYEVLAQSIEKLDWRMAWEGDSYIAKGLYSAIDVAHSLKADVIFVTDGHEAPPLPYSGIPPFEGKPGDVKGLIVGMGGYQKVPIPKFNDDGKEAGVYQADDVPHDNRVGAAPEGSEQREGWNARNAPFGALAAVGDEHLSSMKAGHLEKLAALTGLTFIDSNKTSDLAAALMASSTPITTRTSIPIAAWPGSLALIALIAAYLLGPLRSRLPPKSPLGPPAAALVSARFKEQNV